MLNEAGMQRMAARVFGALLAAQSDGLTAKQIGDVLSVSPAAVSGAVGYLTRTGLGYPRPNIRAIGRRPLRRRHPPGPEAFAIETDRLHELAGWLTKGAAAMPEGSPHEPGCRRRVTSSSSSRPRCRS